MGAFFALLATSVAPSVASAFPGRYIVVFKDSVDRPASVAKGQTEGQEGDLGFVYRHALKGYSATLSEDALKAIERDPRVAYVSVDHRVQIQEEVQLETETNGESESWPEQKEPTGIRRTFATTNKSLDIDEIDNVRVDADVAVIDTGIDPAHPDLNLVGRTNCVPADQKDETAKACVDNRGTDGQSHGTHVAGTIGAIDNEIGVVGMAPGVRLWGVRALDNSGGGYESWILAGVEWVTAHAATIEVVNMSLGCRYCSQPALAAGIAASVEAGVVYVVSAGNDAGDAKYNSPASHPDVITVSALADYDGKAGGLGSATCGYSSKDDTLASFSNFGSMVEVTAPGVCIQSTTPGNSYGTKSGTSMAAPHVTGAAAILAGVSNPNSKTDVEAIRSTIIAEGNSNWTDTSFDGEKEPLLDVGDASVFGRAKTPTATTRAASGVSGAGGATLNGAVNPNGSATTYQFEYGATTGYGSKVPASPQSVGSGTADVKVSQELSGLKAGTTYHYRVLATNAEGTTYGNDETFRIRGPRIEAEAYPATISGSQDPTAKHSLSFSGGVRTLSCTAISLSGELGNASNQFSASATYTGCTSAPGATPATIAMNSCRYVFHALNQGPPYKAKIDVACTKEGDGIEANVYENATKQSEGKALCTYKLAPQAGLEGVDLTTVGVANERGVNVGLKVKTLSASVLKGSKILCGNNPGTVEYTGATTLSESKKEVGVFMAGTEVPKAAFFIAGEASAEPAKQPRAEAEGYPLPYFGNQDETAKHSLSFSGGVRTLSCTAIDLSGELTKASNEFSASGTYTGCTSAPGATPATIAMNSCRYVFHALNQGPPYKAKIDVACSKEGDGIEANVYENATKQSEGSSLCTYKLAPQSGLEGVDLATVGTGSERGVNVGLKVKTLSASVLKGSKILCGNNPGTVEYTGATTLFGW